VNPSSSHTGCGIATSRIVKHGRSRVAVTNEACRDRRPAPPPPPPHPHPRPEPRPPTPTPTARCPRPGAPQPAARESCRARGLQRLPAPSAVSDRVAARTPVARSATRPIRGTASRASLSVAAQREQATRTDPPHWRHGAATRSRSDQECAEDQDEGQDPDEDEVATATTTTITAATTTTITVATATAWRARLRGALAAMPIWRRDSGAMTGGDRGGAVDGNRRRVARPTCRVGRGGESRVPDAAVARPRRRGGGEARRMRRRGESRRERRGGRGEEGRGGAEREAGTDRARGPGEVAARYGRGARAEA
jgi:hypothetical protein